MPLSEQEQRLLDEMERNLYRNDADFVHAVQGRGGRVNYRAIVLGVLLVIAGLAGLVIGVAVQLPVVGIIGFVAMLAGVLVALKPARNTGTSGGTGEPPLASEAGRVGNSRLPKNRSFMNRINERWDRRQDEDR